MLGNKWIASILRKMWFNGLLLKLLYAYVFYCFIVSKISKDAKWWGARAYPKQKINVKIERYVSICPDTSRVRLHTLMTCDNFFFVTM